MSYLLLIPSFDIKRYTFIKFIDTDYYTLHTYLYFLNESRH